MIVVVDLAHDSRWDVGDRKPGGLEHPELDYLGHWPGLFETCLGAEVRVIDGEWTDEALADADLLVLPVPRREHGRPLSAPEVGRVGRLLERRCGVLLLGDGDVPTGDYGEPFRSGICDISFGDSLLGRAGQGASAHLLTYDFDTDISAHPATVGLQRAHLYRPRAVDGGRPGLSPLVRHGAATVVGVAHCGGGRIGAVGNAEMFTLPFLGRHDNARLLTGLVAWLAQGSPPSSVHSGVEVPGGYRAAGAPVAGSADLSETSGTHVLNITPYRSAMVRLADSYLPDPYAELEAFQTEAQLLFHETPRMIRQAVAGFRQNSNECGVLLVKGLPTDPLIPPTPANPSLPAQKNSHLSELWLTAFGTALGSPVAYQQEKQGQLFQNVAPTRQNSTNLSSESSALLLDFHTEIAFHPHLPDYVMLYCLRPDHDRVAKTFTAGVRAVLPRLSLSTRGLLFEPQFRTGVDLTFGSANGTKGNGPLIPVLYGDPYDPFLVFDLDLMIGVTPSAERALGELQVAVNEAKQWVRLDAGDLLIIDNRRAVHGRSEFVARYDGQDRWLQRMCVVGGLAPSAADRRVGGRVIETAFAL